MVSLVNEETLVQPLTKIMLTEVVTREFMPQPSLDAFYFGLMRTTT